MRNNLLHGDYIWTLVSLTLNQIQAERFVPASAVPMPHITGIYRYEPKGPASMNRNSRSPLVALTAPLLPTALAALGHGSARSCANSGFFALGALSTQGYQGSGDQTFRRHAPCAA
jgi:hypothetical protein